MNSRDLRALRRDKEMRRSMYSEKGPAMSAQLDSLLDRERLAECARHDAEMVFPSDAERERRNDRRALELQQAAMYRSEWTPT